ncbi:unnamed protein product, partial [marine sediment metagenome]
MNSAAQAWSLKGLSTSYSQTMPWGSGPGAIV